MDLLTILSTCSLAKDFGLVLAMTMAFSHGDRFTVRAAAEVGDVELSDLSEDDDAPTTARTKEVALADLKRVVDPVVGLLPVPVAWAALYQATPADLLDACINVSIATAQLSEFERACAARGRRARSCALHAYVAAAEIPLFEMAAQDALREHAIPSAGPSVIESEAVYGASVFAGTGTPSRTRGADRVFVHTSSEPAAPKQPAPKESAAPQLRNQTKDPTTR